MVDQDVNAIKSLLNTNFLTGSNKDPIKENRSPAPFPTYAPVDSEIAKLDPEKNASVFSFDHAILRIAAEFEANFHQVEQLNSGRKKAIIDRISRLANLPQPAPLKNIVKAIPGSDLQNARVQFAHEIALFQFMLYIATRKWQERTNFNTKIMDRSSGSLNFQMQNILRETMPNRGVPTQTWAFLRQNIYSWYKLSKETTQFLNLHYQNRLNSNTKPFVDWLGTYLAKNKGWNHLENLTVFELLHSCLEMFCEKRDFDKFFLYGLSRGLILPLIKEKTDCAESVALFAEDDLELYLSELLLLIINEKAKDETAIVLKDQLYDPSYSGNRGLFPDQRHFLADGADLLFYLPSEVVDAEQELNELALLFRHVNEGGILAASCQSYWPLEDSEVAAFLRKESLKNMAIKMIIDLRHLVNESEDLHLPQCWYIIEKVSSKEIRDDNRPQILKAIGGIENKQQLMQLWQKTKDLLGSDRLQNDMTQAVVNVPQPIRLECMRAATQQANLNHAPWTSLTEPAFYDISAKLKRSRTKINNCGTLVVPQSETLFHDNGQNQAVQRSTYIIEIPGKAVFAFDPQSEHQQKVAESVIDKYRKAQPFLFVPDISFHERASFLSALVNSSAIQFWYHLEWEQQNQLNIRTRRRNSFLKLMPALKLLSDGVEEPSLVDISPDSLPEVQQHFQTAWRERNLTHTYSIVLSLEEFVHKHLGILLDCGKYLFEDFEAFRWNLPRRLPELSFSRVQPALDYLQKVSLAEHPAFHIHPIKSVRGDFVVRDVSIEKTSIGTNIYIYNQNEAVLSISGEAEILHWLKSLLEASMGKSWELIAKSTQMPLDVSVMKSQISEYIKMTEYELTATREACALIDEIFCCLFELSLDGENNHSQFIRSYLNPEHVAVNLVGDRTGIFTLK